MESAVPDYLVRSEHTYHPYFSAATTADAILCSGCLHNQQISFRVRHAQDELQKQPTMDLICSACQEALRNYWKSHLKWFIQYQRGQQGQRVGVPCPPHLRQPPIDTPWTLRLRYFVGSLSIMALPCAFFFLILLGIYDWIVGLRIAICLPICLPIASLNLYHLSWTSNFSDWNIIHLFLVGSILCQVQHNPLLLAYWIHKHDPQRKFYFSIFNQALKKYRVSNLFHFNNPMLHWTII
jgi:hypothetical protein